jgi:hypothetical protein
MKANLAPPPPPIFLKCLFFSKYTHLALAYVIFVNTQLALFLDAAGFR